MSGKETGDFTNFEHNDLSFRLAGDGVDFITFGEAVAKAVRFYVYNKRDHQDGFLGHFDLFTDGKTGHWRFSECRNSKGKAYMRSMIRQFQPDDVRFDLNFAKETAKQVEKCHNRNEGTSLEYWDRIERMLSRTNASFAEMYAKL